jgi:hypothetical protein
MKSSTTPDFWESYRALPLNVRHLARKTYHLWQANPVMARFIGSRLRLGFGRLASVYDIARSRASPRR